MKIKCPNCDQRYDIELSMLGNHIKCETCGANFKIEDNIGHQWVSKRLYPCPDCNMNISRNSCVHRFCNGYPYDIASVERYRKSIC